MSKNSAFVFIKPHAVTDAVKDLVKETFGKNGITITKEGSMEAEEIDKFKKIDKHYYAIASKATILTPDKLAIPKDKFQEKFGLEWDDVLKDGKALNAMDACKEFDVDSDALDKMWAACKKAGDLVKFGGGFYCGKLEKDGKGPFYVFNGFFMSMRAKFVTPGVSIYYYAVEWEGTSWEDFRGKVLGPTDPATAPADSLRGGIFAKWKELGLTSEPDVGDNGVHASASPFEALAERANWLGYRIERDPFGKILLKAGISVGTIRDWCKDPQVTFGPIAMTKSLFDTLEDTDSDWCAALCSMIAGAGPSKASTGDPQEKELEELKKQVASYEELSRAVAIIQAHTPQKGVGKGEVKGKGEAKGKGKEEPKGKGKSKGKDEQDEERKGAGKGVGKGKGKGKGKK
eukprot:CAMPEP_0183516848 /NCGR_PEP_ID=MMETSP0371-20130417/14483_1 /TAXON_ID=268820 /ORGANISM="Peridinium aciculiferum, Strain PAER-2" /LENGTH=401 /DNA_ID=CAMNT_0025714643 /DNA_START=70 /DNA_END=1275 /DNA_ORIENTATION=+